jgi:hypothetical protein
MTRTRTNLKMLSEEAKEDMRNIRGRKRKNRKSKKRRESELWQHPKEKAPHKPKSRD